MISDSTFFTINYFRHSDELFNIWKKAQSPDRVINSTFVDKDRVIHYQGYSFIDAPEIQKEMEYLKEVEHYLK